MELSAEQIQANWDKHLKIVDVFITGDRKQQLLDLYTTLSDEMVLHLPQVRFITIMHSLEDILNMLIGLFNVH